MHLYAKERILAIRLLEKASRNPAYAQALGIVAREKVSRKKSEK